MGGALFPGAAAAYAHSFHAKTIPGPREKAAGAGGGRLIALRRRAR